MKFHLAEYIDERIDSADERVRGLLKLVNYEPKL